MELKNKARDTLLAHRIDNKIKFKGTKVNSTIGVFNINFRGMGISTMVFFESADQLCRKLHSCQSRVEDGRRP